MFGCRVYELGILWDDKSGENLWVWLGVDVVIFYDLDIFVIVLMGFCYLGMGKFGDLLLRKECVL